MAEDRKLLIPVYLNQRIVFDLLAMLQGGISTVTSVSKTEQSADEKSRKMGGSFGLSQALSSLLKIDLSADATSTKAGSEETRRTEERFHTPASLFYTLRNLLKSQNLLVIDGPGARPTSGDIVEFQSTLKLNPLVETMDAISALLNLAEIFVEPPPSQQGKKATRKNESGQVKQQIESFSKSLKDGDSIDLTTDLLESKYKAIVTIETQYLNDPLMLDLVDGRFRVLGKVIRSIPDDSDAVSLIRRSPLSRMPSSILTETFGKLEQTMASKGFDFPELQWEVKGPVIQVIPVSVFS